MLLRPSNAMRVAPLLLASRSLPRRWCAAAMSSRAAPDVPPGSSAGGAAARGDLEALKNLCERQPAAANARDPTGNTPLIWASEYGQAQAVDFLVGKDADLGARGMTGNCALHRACRRGHAQVTQALVQAGAPLDELNDKRQSSLHISAFYRHSGIVKLLLEAGANPNIRDSKGRTPAEDTKDADIAAAISAKQ